jgi:hypothetical protein
MRSCASATKSFGSVKSIVQDFSTSTVALSFHSSQRQKVIGSPSTRLAGRRILPLVVSRCRDEATGASEPLPKELFLSDSFNAGASGDAHVVDARQLSLNHQTSFTDSLPSSLGVNLGLWLKNQRGAARWGNQKGGGVKRS